MAVNAGVLALVASGGLATDGTWPIYAAIAVGGVGRSFLGPVYNALFARALKREQFARGAGMGSVVFQAGLVLGPAIGGLLVGAAGKSVAYALAAGFAIAAALALLRMPVTEPDYIAAIGLARHLSPTRSNGLAALLAFIREHARTAPAA